MWMLFGIVGGLLAGLIVRNVSGIKAMLVLAAPLLVWWLAYFGVIGPGMNDNNHPQFMLAMLGIMIGIGLPRLLDWRREKSSATEL
ncbi:hypothetical protein [Kocuria sp.]|uniref:hypothetical protein n=1 Tax=Kocuria sp. TaxID=1871328 RepID=UPI0026DF7151|nr:hypothetical protein [Kocuria sp.]MDO5617393.1 hypothetical protein [Kocuria sp.]